MTTATDTAEDTATDTTGGGTDAKKAHDFRRRTRALTETYRANRLSRYPNPPTMNIAKLLADAKTEAEAVGSPDRMVRLLADIYVQPTSGGGDTYTIRARYPQWDDAAQGYDQFAVNPELPDGITEVSTDRVLRACRSHMLAWPHITASVDNLLAGQFVTLADNRLSANVAITMTFTADDLANAGRTELSTDMTEQDIKYTLALMARNALRNDPYTHLSYELTTPSGIVVTPPTA